MRKLDAIYRNGEGASQRKVVFCLTYTAKHDILKLALFLLMGTRWEKCVVRKMVPLAK
jgi:hypothetical protein